MLKEFTHINWNDFHFLRLDYIWVAIPVLSVVLLGLFLYKEPNTWKKHIAKHLQPYVISKGTAWKSRLMHLSVLIMFVIGFISFFGPAWSKIKAPAKKVKSQLIIALDLSQSMLVADISPSRLDRAKFKIHDLLKANPRAETSLWVFAGSTHTAIPFTTDYKIIIDQLDGLKPRMMPIKGTGFNVLFNKIDSTFNDNQAEGKILLITDDLNDLSLEKVSEFLQQNNVKLYIYPFATVDGAIIPRTKETSVLNVDKLNGLSQMDRVNIMEVTLDDSDVVNLAKTISSNIVFEDKSEEEDENWQDNGYWLLFPLAFIFLFSFRKGWALNLIVIMLSFSSCSEDKSMNSEKFKFIDLWFTSSYQAQKEYDKGEYFKAAQGFSDPMRKGVAYFKAGDFSSAETAFAKDTTINGLYNLGLTYAKLGQLEKAKSVFEKIVKSDESNKNASANLKFIIKAIDELSIEDVALNEDPKKANNTQNDSPEDLSGGGQKATKKDMEKERKEETAQTGKRKGKEMDELPDDFKSGEGEIPKNILMRKVDDDPALFLIKKFRYQVKKNLVEVEKTTHKW